MVEPRRSRSRTAPASTATRSTGCSSEVVPFIQRDSHTHEIALTGASMGAYHAANLALKRADLFPLAICMSGNYDPAQWHGWGERGEGAYFNNPMDYVGNLHGDHLDWLRERVSLLLVVGQGQWEDTTGSLHSTRRFADRCWTRRGCGASSTSGGTTSHTTGRAGERRSPTICHGSADARHRQAPDRPAPRHRGGLAARLRDARRARSGRSRRGGDDARADDRAHHDRAVPLDVQAALRPRDRPARLVVLRPARVAEEGRADGRRVPAQQPVHVPVDGEARGLLRDAAARHQGPQDGPDPAQEPAGDVALPVHGGEVQPAVRPRRGGRSRSATRCS